MRRTKYVVHANGEIARFSSYLHAMQFAAMVSQFNRYAEVLANDGLVGQYRNGRSTPEFKQHHESVFAGMPAQKSNPG